VSKEGDVYEVPVAVAKMSTLVATTIDDDDDDDEVREIPLPNVKDAVLTKVIEYCTRYKEEPMTPITTPLKSSKIEDLVQPWYADFVKVEQALLFELVTAANFMDIKPLLDLTCLAVSVLIKVCTNNLPTEEGQDCSDTGFPQASDSPNTLVLSIFRTCRGNQPVNFGQFSISATTSHQRKKRKSAKKTNGWNTLPIRGRKFPALLIREAASIWLGGGFVPMR
jgi:S-phase kinase-associated protein 1